MFFVARLRARGGRSTAALAVALLAIACSPSSRGKAQIPAQAGTETPLARVAAQVTPAVVSIESEFSAAVAAQMQAQEQGIPPGLIPPQMRPQGPARAGGSGFIVSKDGYILTNNHVVAGAQRVSVTLPDRRIFQAKVIGADPSTDVALIQIQGSDFPTIPLGNDSTVQVGDPVLAVGNPLGLDFTVTAGIISAKGRSGQLRGLFSSDYAIVDFLQTDAVINPGNSGGPLIDMSGRVIGINSAIESPTGVYAGYGFAVPIGLAKMVMNDFLKYGRVRRAVIGISVQDVGPADARAAGLSRIAGVLVGGFSGPNSPGQRAGLQPGDVILAVDGHPVDRVSQFQRLIFGYQPGQTVTLDVQRFGARRTVRVTLGEAPAPRDTTATAAAPADNTTRGRLGIGVAPVTPEIAAQLRLPPGATGLAVAAVDPSGPSAQLLFPGDVITAVVGPEGTRPIRTVVELQAATQNPRNGVVSLLVTSAQGTRVVNVPVRQ